MHEVQALNDRALWFKVIKFIITEDLFKLPSSLLEARATIFYKTIVYFLERCLVASNVISTLSNIVWEVKQRKMKVSCIFSFDILGQLLFYFIKVLYAQSDHDCSSQNLSSNKTSGAGDTWLGLWCIWLIMEVSLWLCVGVQGYGNHNTNISMGDILGLWKSLRDHNVIPCRNNFCLPKNWLDVNNSEFGERAPNFTKDNFH